MLQINDESIIKDWYLPETAKEIEQDFATRVSVSEEFDSEHTELNFLRWPNSEKICPSEIQSTPLDWCYLGRDPGPDNLLALNVALSDWGVSSWTHKHLCNLITPVLLRSPEVLIGAEWDSKTDIWNLGAIVVEIMECVRVFDGRSRDSNEYDVKNHLHEIVDIFGRFPQSLLARGNQWFVHEVFNEDGTVKDKEPMQRGQLDDQISSLEGQDKTNFMNMLRNMMMIDPQQRKSARELLDEPWLKDVE
jgi:serine/threonine-protein kinase SRPK3